MRKILTTQSKVLFGFTRQYKHTPLVLTCISIEVREENETRNVPTVYQSKLH